jgi:serine/threonine protein kinase
MAPELLINLLNINKNNYNSATDIWACGILIYELFTCGKLPYNEIHEDEVEQVLILFFFLIRINQNFELFFNQNSDFYS